MSFDDIEIVSVKGNHDRIHFLCMSKDEAINDKDNADLNEKKCIIVRYKIVNFCYYHKNQ